EVEVAVAIHARHGVEHARARALQLTAVIEADVVHALGVVQVGVDARIVAVVEKEIAPITRDERLHGLAVVAADGDALRVAEAVVLGPRRRLDAPLRATAGRQQQAERRRTASHVPNRSAARARAFAASSSRLRGGALVSSECSSLRATAATSSTADKNAASLALEGLLKPV